jgi:hypothetical protein
MPEISRFLGIIIRMYADEHAPPHFHGEHEAMFKIETGEILEGRFPKNHAIIVKAWAAIHKKELMNNWNSLTSGKGFKKID